MAQVEQPRPPDDRARATKGGVVGGIAGGIALSAFLIVFSLAQGGPLWPVFKAAGIPFFNDARVMDPGFDAAAVLVGTLSHLAVSIVWGVLFGLLFYGMGKAATVGAGLFWGLVVWLGMFYVVLPLVGAFFITQNTPVWVAVAEHLVFGLFVALGFLPFQRQVPRKTRPAAAVPEGRPLELPRRTPVTP